MRTSMAMAWAPVVEWVRRACVRGSAARGAPSGRETAVGAVGAGSALTDGAGDPAQVDVQALTGPASEGSQEEGGGGAQCDGRRALRPVAHVMGNHAVIVSIPARCSAAPS
ncbi:hypothetical protein Srut_02040 [Streptomyces rutgersensis]|nr:hypothetical protein Srut_02040 [Streptomyces rutgersensis]